MNKVIRYVVPVLLFSMFAVAQNTLTFQADMSVLISGGFNAGTDSIIIRNNICGINVAAMLQI